MVRLACSTLLSATLCIEELPRPASNPTHAPNAIDLDDQSYFPSAREAPTIVICDFEVKHANVVGYITRQIRSRYSNAELYFAMFGAMTRVADLKIASFDELTGAEIMRTAEFSAVFIAVTMSPPGIERPLELR